MIHGSELELRGLSWGDLKLGQLSSVRGAKEVSVPARS
jgi:hypothetical protein